jgi:uncharacterized protein YbjT (DUF2867 family)
MTTSGKTLTIIGATGKMAVPLVHYLHGRGHRLKIISSRPDRARAILPRGLEIVFGDVLRRSSLDDALRGTRHLYINLSTNSVRPDLPFYAEREGVANIVAAADRAGVAQILQMSSLELLHKEFNADGFVYNRSFIRDQGHQYLFASNIPYTLFYCSAFLDIIPWHIIKGRFMAIGPKPFPVYATNSHDYARLVEAAIGHKPALYGKFPVQGSEADPFYDLARRFLEVYRPGTPFRGLPVGAGKILAALKPGMKIVIHANRFLGQYRERLVAHETWDTLGKPEMDVEKFALHLKHSTHAATAAGL